MGGVRNGAETYETRLRSTLFHIQRTVLYRARRKSPQLTLPGAVRNSITSRAARTCPIPDRSRCVSACRQNRFSLLQQLQQPTLVP